MNLLGIRWNGFGRSLLFAVLAAGVLPLWMVVFGPVVGGHTALSALLVATVAVYLAGLSGEGARRACGVFLAAAAVASGLAILARTTTEEVVALALLLGVARMAILPSGATPRAVVVEVLLGVAGLWFARFLAGPSLVGAMLGVWGFFLVQSFRFLVVTSTASGSGGRQADPFDEAFRRASVILDG